MTPTTMPTVRHLAFLLVALIFPAAVFAPPPRPQITGIAVVRFYVTNMDSARAFYANTLGLPRLTQGCLTPPPSVDCFFISPTQHLELLAGPAPDKNNLLESVAFRVSDAQALRQHLLAHGLKPEEITKTESGDELFAIRDPENHSIFFISQAGHAGAFVTGHPAVSSRLIHAGFVVHDRAAEDKFYKDILGFHVYWHGGMKDDQTDWVDMQVPDGTDWIEYMLNVSASASHKTLGVMNHIALGVPDIHAAEKQLIANGWQPTEQPKIGRDGKWQLNLYDPDQTRVELMEFTPTQKPCCSEYTGPNPGPHQ